MKHIKRLTIAGLTAVMLFSGVPYVQMTDTASPAITTTKEVVHAAAKKLTKKQKKIYLKVLMKERLNDNRFFDEDCWKWLYEDERVSSDIEYEGISYNYFGFYDLNGDGVKEMLIFEDFAPWGRNGFGGCIYDKEGNAVEGAVEYIYMDDEFLSTTKLDTVNSVYPNSIFSCIGGTGNGYYLELFYQWKKGEDKPELIAGMAKGTNGAGCGVFERYRLKGKDVTKEKFDEWVKFLGNPRINGYAGLVDIFLVPSDQQKKMKWYSVNEANVKKYLG